jgi:hypothetical protein
MIVRWEHICFSLGWEYRAEIAAVNDPEVGDGVGDGVGGDCPNPCTLGSYTRFLLFTGG